MHPKKRVILSGVDHQGGATLILSLLLMAILTMLATTAMQSSVLNYKVEFSRTGFHRSLAGLENVQVKAAKEIKAFIDSRAANVGQGDSISEGFLLVDELLSMEKGLGKKNEASLIRTLSYSLPDMQVEVFISRLRLSQRNTHPQMQQHNAYAHPVLEPASEQYLYLQLHCIGRSTLNQTQSPVHIVGDYRFEV